LAKLIYSTIASLDGYVEDDAGRFDWARPDEEVHAFVNDLERPVGHYLYGRRMYETMAVWETMGTASTDPPVVREFAAIWRAADKRVYSRTLTGVASARTRVEHEFDAESLRHLKETASSDITVGGSTLAGQAIAAGLVDEIHLFLTPVLVGGGKRALPDGVRTGLRLIDEHRFRGGVVHLRYRAGT
jgi:dihydrofolate reductase